MTYESRGKGGSLERGGQAPSGLAGFHPELAAQNVGRPTKGPQDVPMKGSPRPFSTHVAESGEEASARGAARAKRSAWGAWERVSQPVVVWASACIVPSVQPVL